MRSVNIVRNVLFGFLFALAVITLALAGSLISSYEGLVYVYMALDLAAACLLIIVLIPSVVIEFFRKGAFSSMVAVELGWTSVMMIIWVAAAGETTAELPFVSCRFVNPRTLFIDRAATSSCISKQQALEAMVWLGFIALLAWFITLISLASVAHSRGNTSVWKKSITNITLERVVRAKGAGDGYQSYASGQPMQQQYGGVPGQQSYPPHPAAQPLQQHAGGYPLQTLPQQVQQHTDHSTNTSLPGHASPQSFGQYNNGVAQV